METNEIEINMPNLNDDVASKGWKPKLWIAILVGVFFNAFALLYVNRPRLFWIYFILTYAVAILQLVFSNCIAEIVAMEFISLSLVFSIICPVHAALLTKTYDISSKRGWYSKLWILPASYTVIFVSIFCFRSFLYEPFSIPAASMAPNYNKGDLIVVKKFWFGRYGTFGFDFLNPGVSHNDLMQRGKVYVFYPPDKDVAFIMRLIGLPGDEISFDADGISLNGEKLLTSFSKNNGNGFVEYKEMIGETSYSISRFVVKRLSKSGIYVVPEGHYFMLGDSRDNSLDSRFWGAVDSKSIVGEVVYVFQNKKEPTLSQGL